MNLKKLKYLGIVGGLVVLLLTTSQFMRTYREGEPKWNYIFMIFGMAIILLYTLFNTSKNKRQSRGQNDNRRS